MNMTEFTIAIPTYNGEQRLPEVLECLRSQTGTDHIALEILVVDNNSSDQTAQAIKAYQDNFPYPVRYILEPHQGAAFARKRAIQVAQSELVGFLDDDNLPHPNWVAAACAFAVHHSKAGAYGSLIHADFEVAPPQNFHRLAPFLAITQRGKKPRCYDPNRRLLPPSAGLVVRRQAWLESVPEHTILSGRIGGSLMAGEDLEVVSHIQRAGWEIWYNPDMEIVHKIPRWRLEKDYLLPLLRGVGLSRWITRRLSVQPWQRPWLLAAYLLSDSSKIIRHLLKYGTQVKTDIIAACELELFVSSLISPFYLGIKGYFKQNLSNGVAKNVH